MTPEEAIEKTKGILPSKETLAIREAFNYEKGIQLGIEALERLKLLRENIPHRNTYALIEQLLPSETDEH